MGDTKLRCWTSTLNAVLVFPGAQGVLFIPLTKAGSQRCEHQENLIKFLLS